jgi:transposase
MQEIRFIGLDVHKESISIAVAEGGGGPSETIETIPNDVVVVLKCLRKLAGGRRVRCCYEAGPTGFGLCRDRGADPRRGDGSYA